MLTPIKNLYIFSSKIELLTLIFSFILILLADSLFKMLNADHYMNNMTVKIDLISEEEDNLIMIGGSSMGWSLDSEIIKNEFGNYNVVNFGLHAGLSLEFVLDVILPYIGEGDVLIIAAEYEYFLNSKNNDELELFTRNLITDSVKNPIFNRYLFRFNKFTSSLSFYYLKDKSGSIYRSGNLNQFGDIVAHHLISDEFHLPPVGVLESNVQQGRFDFIEKFIYDSKSKNIEVFLSLPPVSTSYELVNYIKMYEIVEEMIKRDLPLISEIQNYVFDDFNFYDTHYHMTRDGRVIRTRNLVLDIFRVKFAF